MGYLQKPTNLHELSKTNESNINKTQLKLSLGETTSKVGGWILKVETHQLASTSCWWVYWIVTLCLGGGDQLSYLDFFGSPISHRCSYTPVGSTVLGSPNGRSGGHIDADFNLEFVFLVTTLHRHWNSKALWNNTVPNSPKFYGHEVERNHLHLGCSPFGSCYPQRSEPTSNYSCCSHSRWPHSCWFTAMVSTNGHTEGSAATLTSPWFGGSKRSQISAMPFSYGSTDLWQNKDACYLLGIHCGCESARWTNRIHPDTSCSTSWSIWSALWSWGLKSCRTRGRLVLYQVPWLHWQFTAPYWCAVCGPIDPIGMSDASSCLYFIGADRLRAQLPIDWIRQK